MPVQVDVFSPMPESWGLCQSCETLMSRAEIKDSDNFRGLEAYPPDWYEDFQRLSDAVLDLAHRYGESVNIRLYDPRSLPGLFKAIRHGVHRYPTFLISKREKVIGLDLPAIERFLSQAGARLTTPIESERDYEQR
jgi:hypothetical protein